MAYSTSHHKHMKAYSVDLRTKKVEPMNRAFDSGALQKAKALHLEK
jgi:hypothetical protein